MAEVSVSSETKKLERRRVSCDTLCSSNSSCVLQKRKPLHPLARSVQTRSTNPVTQRVLSAKFLRFKTLQNQLNDANFHIAQLINENKLLKNLQKRQDHALSKYEGTSAQLPQVLESHQEEIRVLLSKNKTFKMKIKELTDLLKSRDEELITVRDQFKHLQSLTKNKNLEEREILHEKVEDLSGKLSKSESTISILNRKLLLETKNYKFKLNSEITKHKESQKELNKAYDQLRNKASKSEREKNPQSIRYQSVDKKSHLCVEKRLIEKPRSEKSHSPNTSSSITNMSDDLSTQDQDVDSGLEQFLDTDNDANNKQLVCYTGGLEGDLDSASEVQLKEMVNNLHMKSSKLDEKIREEMQCYSSEVFKSAKIATDMVAKHTSEYENAIKETEEIMETLKHADARNDKLSQYASNGKQFYDYSLQSHKNSNDVMIAQFLKNEKKFDYILEEDLLNEKPTKKVTICEPRDQADKKKLLAKLKAIDNGDNKVDNITIVTDMKQAKSDLMKELFG